MISYAPISPSGRGLGCYLPDGFFTHVFALFFTAILHAILYPVLYPVLYRQFPFELNFKGAKV